MDLCRPVIDIKVLVAHCNVYNLNYTKILKLKVDFRVENKIYIQITRKLAHSKEKENKFLTKKNLNRSYLSLPKAETVSSILWLTLVEKFVGKTCDYMIDWRANEEDHWNIERYELDRHKVGCALTKVI